ncbi:hypothetical protein SRHO_G00210580 [Serrasalmus rhombeus]
MKAPPLCPLFFSSFLPLSPSLWSVCVDCVDLDMGWATAIVIGDILVTLGVILIVYLCAKKKAGPAPRQRATPGRQAGAPPPPNPDYQVLNPATRSRDVYAEAVRKH